MLSQPATLAGQVQVELHLPTSLIHPAFNVMILALK